jgi:perosamine synthetase
VVPESSESFALQNEPLQHMKDNSAFVFKVVQAIEAVTGGLPVALHEPLFNGNELNYTRECIESGFVSSVGAFVNRFEVELAESVDAKFAIATVNGTSALHLALLAAGVMPGDEVICPSLTFVATANAISYCGAKPLFVDITTVDLGVDSCKIEDFLASNTARRKEGLFNKDTGCRISAIMPMHTFGHSVNLQDIMMVADKYDLPVIEDAAEALGSTYQEKHVGTRGLLGVFSFNGNKIVTTGGGGAVVTNDEVLARKVKHLSTTAKLPHNWKFEHDQIGFNYRMPNINAALGCAQLEQLPKFVDAKRKLFSMYDRTFTNVEEITLFRELPDRQSNYWLQTIVLSEKYQFELPSVIETAQKAGLQLRPAWTPLHRLTPFVQCPRTDLSVTDNLANRIINIPSSAILGLKL